ncbi:metallophosphoesterase family protein [Zavarzinella formosa]|uniref:metallophosphoesterase family protein n=1 Tax=Zavarzinella formosa TaxID=360055 RepID=UPI000300B776|nr:metallophosphoesterase [Zavarzinella formosa]
MNDPVTVIIPGDLHLTEPGLPNHVAARWAIDEANDLIRPDFVQFIGDNVQDGTPGQFALFRDLTGRLTAPWFALVGDHDTAGDPAATAFREHVGAPTGSHSVGGFRFLRLNTQEGKPVGLSPEQLDWFRTETDAALSAGERVVVFQHNYPYQIWEDFAGPGIDGWREIVQTRRVHAILCGHTHYWQAANDGRNAVMATRSIGDPEGGSPGYMIAFFQGEDFAVAYRTVEDTGPLALITHPREALLATGPSHVVRGADELRVRVWSRGSVSGVAGRIDDGPWFDLQPADGRNWAAPLPDARLSKGIHRLKIRADATDGTAESEIEFAVDPTGRHTAVPMVRPVVGFTNYC